MTGFVGSMLDTHPTRLSWLRQ